MKDKTPVERLKDAVALTLLELLDFIQPFFIRWRSLWTDETSRRNVKQQRDALAQMLVHPYFTAQKKRPGTITRALKGPFKHERY